MDRSAHIIPRGRLVLIDGKVTQGEWSDALLLAGENPKVVCERLGHSFSVKLAHYRHTRTKTGSQVAARNSLITFGWEAGIRTPIGGFRVRSPTVRRPPNRNLNLRAGALVCQTRTENGLWILAFGLGLCN